MEYELRLFGMFGYTIVPNGHIEWFVFDNKGNHVGRIEYVNISNNKYGYKVDVNSNDLLISYTRDEVDTDLFFKYICIKRSNKLCGFSIKLDKTLGICYSSESGSYINLIINPGKEIKVSIDNELVELNEALVNNINYLKYKYSKDSNSFSLYNDREYLGYRVCRCVETKSIKNYSKCDDINDEIIKHNKGISIVERVYNILNDEIPFISEYLFSLLDLKLNCFNTDTVHLLFNSLSEKKNLMRNLSGRFE